MRALESEGWIRSAPIREAFLSVPRELFVPDFAGRHGLEAVYRDEAIMTVELDPEVAREARRNLRAGRFRARVVGGDGRNGFAQRAPFDRIIATASSPDVPVAWFEQLEPHGLLEAPFRLAASGAQAIPLLRKTRTGFRSTSVIAGGFMPLRVAGEDGAEELRPPILTVSDSTGTPVLQLFGESVTTLSEPAKRRLLSIALAAGRRRPLGLRASSSALVLFLSLSVPARHLVTRAPRLGVGVITRDGKSLALIERSRARSSSIAKLSVYGSDAAAELLLEHAREWDRRGRPAESDLAIMVSYDARRTSKLSVRWPRADTRS